MHMSPVEVTLIGSTLTMAASGLVSELSDGGARLSALGVAGLSCAVAIAAITGMVVQYKDSKKDTQRYEALTAENTKAITTMTEVARSSNTLSVEIKDALREQTGALKQLKFIREL